MNPSERQRYSNSASSAAEFRSHRNPDPSELLLLQYEPGCGSQVRDSPYNSDSSIPKYANRFSQDPVNRGHTSTLSSTGKDGINRFRRDAGIEPILGNEERDVSWKELVSNDKLASVLWDVTNRHVGFQSGDESVEKCLDEFSNKRRAIAPYVLSVTVRENAHFLRDFIHNISKYSHLHDLRTVQHYYDQFRDILKDHQSYHTALKGVIEGMDQDMKYAIICAQRRFCSCFSSQDIVRYEEQFSSLSQYNYLLRGYLLCGYYIDPIIRAIFIVTGMILNCTILIIFSKHKYTVTQCDVMVMNIAVTGILILIVYIPLHYIHFYYSSIIPHEEFSDNGLFTSVQSAVISLSAVSLLTLRALRHIEMFHPLNGTVLCVPLPTMWQRVLCILTVWVWALSVATLTYMFNDHPNIGYLFAPSLYIVLYVLILPTAMKRFKIHFEKGFVPPEEEKLISSITVTQLSKTFWMTHVPLFVWMAVERLCGFVLKLASVNYSYAEILFCYIHFSYACVNAAALCRSSSGFTKLLYRHVLRCSYGQKGQQQVMLHETGHSVPETQAPST